MTPEEEPFVVASRPMGLRPGYDAGRLNSLADDLEADAFLALTADSGECEHPIRRIVNT